MIILDWPVQAAFLSLPPSNIDSPVRTLFKGTLCSLILLDLGNVPDISVEGRLRRADEGIAAVDGEVPNRLGNDWPAREVPIRGEVKEVIDDVDINDEDDIRRDDDGVVRSCSMRRFICTIPFE